MKSPTRGRDVLAQNLTALIAAEQGGMRAIAERVGIGEGTLSRIAKGQTAATLDTIDTLAAYFHLEPWQLLCPQFDRSNPPILAQVCEQQLELLARFKALAALLPRDN